MPSRSDILIVGPTASGKSDLALRVAEATGAEICSMDAFQIYRGLDIGTGKLANVERRGIYHHLMDLADSLDSFSVADYLEHAKETLADLRARDKTAIWVGGTGLYFRALREGLSPVPASDPSVTRELSEWTTDRLCAEIQKVDPVWAGSADLKNPRRMIRALAVFKQTGRPLSDWHRVKGCGLIEAGKAYFLQPSPEPLKRNIEKRIGGMWQAGWQAEVGKLLERKGWRDSQSAKALGYPQVASYLEGNLSENACLETIRMKTWQYARRQVTWFRAEKGLVVLEGTEEGLLRIIDKNTKP